MAAVKNSTARPGNPGLFRHQVTQHRLCDCGCGQPTAYFSDGRWCGPQTAVLRVEALDGDLFNFVKSMAKENPAVVAKATSMGLSLEEYLALGRVSMTHDPMLMKAFEQGMELPYDGSDLPRVPPPFDPRLN